MDFADADQRVVAVAGDWHGSISWVQTVLPALARVAPEVRTVLHVGDFGISRGLRGRVFLDAVDFWCKTAGIEQILVTPGNHEDWEWLDADFASMPGEPVPISAAVSVLPRGFRFTVGSTSFLSFGGAASIDYALRVEGRDWFPTEVPTEEEVAAAIASGRVDVLITHETVNGGTVASEQVLLANPQGWNAEELAYSALSRDRVTRVWAALAPQVLVHGHMHVADDIRLAGGQRIYSLGRDFQDRNVGLLDVDTLSWKWVTEVDTHGKVKRTRDIEGRYLTRPTDLPGE